MFLFSGVGPVNAQTTIDSYSYSGTMRCSGVGKSVAVTNGSISDIAQDVVSAANSTEAGCTNPGSYNNIYEFSRRVDLTLWFNCQSVTNCGGSSTDNFSVTAVC